MDIDSILRRCQRVPSADSASKVLRHMQRSEKLLRQGHLLPVDTSIQRHLPASIVPGPTALYSKPSFGLFKLADRRPLPEPRGALFDICTENFHHALPVDSVMCRLEDAALGQLAEPAAAVQDHVQAHTPAPPTVAPDAQPEPPDTQTKAPKQKEKKEKKEKEKKEKKDKKEKREKKDKREKGDKKEKKDKEKKRKRSAE